MRLFEMYPTWTKPCLRFPMNLVVKNNKVYPIIRTNKEIRTIPYWEYKNKPKIFFEDKGKEKKFNKIEETKITIPEFIPMNELEECRLSMSIDITQWYNNLIYAYQKEMVKKLLEEGDVKITRSRYMEEYNEI